MNLLANSKDSVVQGAFTSKAIFLHFVPKEGRNSHLAEEGNVYLLSCKRNIAEK
jgi:hypothetical protein